MHDDQRREIEELVDLLSKLQLNELEFEKKGVRIRVRRDHSPAPPQPSPSVPPSPQDQSPLPETLPQEINSRACPLPYGDLPNSGNILSLTFSGC